MPPDIVETPADTEETYTDTTKTPAHMLEMPADTEETWHSHVEDAY